MQLYYDETKKEITDIYDAKYEIMYEPADGATGTQTRTYTYKDAGGNTKSEKITFVTDINKAKREYKGILNNKNGYTGRYTKSGVNAVVDYTLDNKVYVYGTARRSRK